MANSGLDPARPLRLVLAFTAILIVVMIGGSAAYTSMVLHAGDSDGESLATARGAYRLFRAARGWPRAKAELGP